MKIAAVVLLVVLAVLAAVICYGALHWNAGTRALRSRLEAARTSVRPGVVDFRELEGLPPPVQRYFRTVLTEGRPMLTGARLRHAGTFNMDDAKDRWIRFTSDQRIITRRPGFDWDARMRMLPGLTVRVHDAYVAGEGLLHAAVLGVIPVADLRGTREMAEGELLRFLAEGVWYPTALLPSQGVRWEAVDARSARATLVDGAIAVMLTFGFGDDGMIEAVRAEARGGAVPCDPVAGGATRRS